MKKIALILIIFCILFSGCIGPSEPPEELPEDFEIEYGSGAMHLEWGQYNLKIDNMGNAVFEKTQGTDLSRKYEFTANEAELKIIYGAVMINNFFSLDDQYEDPAIMDGGWTEISIKANGERKTVKLLNYSQRQFEKVEAKIVGLIVSKLGDDAFSFTDLLDE